MKCSLFLHVHIFFILILHFLLISLSVSSPIKISPFRLYPSLSVHLLSLDGYTLLDFLVLFHFSNNFLCLQDIRLQQGMNKLKVSYQITPSPFYLLWLLLSKNFVTGFLGWHLFDWSHFGFGFILSLESHVSMSTP